MAETPNYAPPSGNISEQESLAGVIKFMIRKHQQQTDDMLPAVIVSYDRTTNRAKVQPLIAYVTTANQQVKRAPVGSVPVLTLGGGGFVMSFPLKPGDLGWIKANDRDLSTFWQNLGPAAPPSQRQKTFEDAMFIPDVMMKGVTIADEDADAVVLQSLDGSVRIALMSDTIKMTAPNIILDTPLTTITGEIQAGTNPSYSRTATFNGTITTTGDVVAGSISLDTHVHTGVQPGGGDTGGPR